MPGPLSKYFGTPMDPSGKPLFWGEPGEFPFRGMPPTMLKGDEIEDIPLVYDAKSELLELPKDQQRYNEIIDHCANGWWQLRHEKFFDMNAEKGTLTVFLAWLEIYGETPNNKSAWEAMRNVQRRTNTGSE
jgi:hypothetical protein